MENEKLNFTEKAIAIVVGFFAWFVGGFIMSQIYRSQGKVLKSKSLSKYYWLGIFLSIITLIAVIVIS